MSWNINAMRTKLEKEIVLNLITKYDVVSLNEIKSQCQVSVPGYISFISRDFTFLHRGGTCVLGQEYVCPSVTEVDVSIPDLGWEALASLGHRLRRTHPRPGMV